ncbi:MAG: LysR family transcriptional regulator [Hyphomicrobiales bacterium]
MADVSDWAVFARTAELKSLSAAGRDLRLSAAVVSNRIAKLEKRLGVRLLNRTTRRVNLTEEGQQFYEHCTKILHEIELIESTIGSGSNRPRGAITVTAPAGFGRRHVAPFMPAFTERHPDVQVRLHLSDRLTDVIQEGTDVAIRIADIKAYSFIMKKLASNTRVIVGAPDYLEKHGEPREPDDLLNHNCLLLRFPGSQQFQWTLEGPGGAATVPVAGNLDSDDGEAILEWARGGAGLALKSMWEVGDDIREGRLRAVLPEWAPIGHAIYAIYPHSRLMPTRVRAFIDFLAGIYGPRPYWETGAARPDRSIS